MSRLENFQQAVTMGENVEEQGSNVVEFPIEKIPYEAFSAPPVNEPQTRLIIYAKVAYLAPLYSLLYDIVFNPFFARIDLIYLHQRVTIRGQNLEPLVVALHAHAAVWLREYVPLAHVLPSDKRSPVIISINVDAAAVKSFAESGE